jgi:hypothetical protein
LAAGKTIDSEFGSLGDTVGKALTRLDNAFLQYIGTSDEIRQGTNTIALAINALAENFRTLAQAVTLLGVAVAARFIPIYGKMLAAFVATRVAAITNAQAINVATKAAAGNAAMAAGMAKAQRAAAGSMASSAIIVGNTGKAVVATTGAFAGLRASVIGLGRGITAALGGPVGLLIAGMFLLSQRTTDADRAAELHNETIAKAAELQGKLATATGESAENLKKERDEMIRAAEAKVKNAQATLALVEAEVKRVNIQNAFLVGRAGFDPSQGPLTAGEQGQLEAARKEVELLQSRLEELVGQFNTLDTSTAGTGGTGGGGDAKELEKKQKQIESIINSLKRESEQLSIQG